MPVYRPPVHGVAYSEAYVEAMAVAPVNRVIYSTLEFHHADLAAPIRLVLGAEDISARLEVGAPVGGNTIVTWTAVRLGLHLPEESDEAASPTSEFWIDGVSSIIGAQLEQVAKTLTPVTVLVRMYAGDDLSGPANLPPARFDVLRAVCDETRVTCTAGYADQANRRFPGKSFLPLQYPGLAAR